MPITVDQLRRHFLAAWGPDTCYPNMREEWTPENPSRDQCGMTALVVQDEVVGGTVVLRPPDGPRYHREQYELLRRRVLGSLAPPS